MATVKGFYDDIHWPECSILSYSISKEKGEVCVRIRKGLHIYDPHPLAPTWNPDEPCEVLIKGVVKSSLSLNPYTDDGEGFLGEKKEELDFAEAGTAEEFTIEGVKVDENGKGEGWITWDILGAEFILSDLK